MAYTRRIIAGMADSHSGFELGLTNPETVIMDKKGNDIPITINETQTFLWEVFTQGIEDIKKLAGKDEIVPLHVGDIAHGIKHPAELIDTRAANQATYAYYSMLPFYRLKNVKTVGLAIGTGAHNLGEGSMEVLIRDRFRAEYPKVNTQVFYHGLANMDGYQIDLAHHGPGPGTRNWLTGNVARLYLQSLIQDELDAGSKPPDLVLRAHFHQYVKQWFSKTHEGVEYESWLVIMPPLCIPGDWTHQATKSVYRIKPGIIAFEVINGKLIDIYPFTNTLDIRTVIDL